MWPGQEARIPGFGGFPPETIRFLLQLRGYDHKGWLDAHRADYGAFWLAPAKAFVLAAGELLAELASGIRVELAGVAARLEAAGYRLGGAARKRPSPGVAERRPAGRFLRHKAVFVHRDEPADDRVHTGRAGPGPGPGSGLVKSRGRCRLLRSVYRAERVHASTSVVG